MADLSITAANVVAASGATINTGVAGATITAGQTLYGPATGLLTANSDTSATTAACVGIALNGGSSGQTISYISGGDVTIGATLTAGGVYVVSGTADGGIAPVADLATGWFTCVLLIAKTTTLATVILKGANPLTAHG